MSLAKTRRSPRETHSPPSLFALSACLARGNLGSGRRPGCVNRRSSADEGCGRIVIRPCGGCVLTVSCAWAREGKEAGPVSVGHRPRVELRCECAPDGLASRAGGHCGAGDYFTKRMSSMNRLPVPSADGLLRSPTPMYIVLTDLRFTPVNWLSGIFHSSHWLFKTRLVSG